MSDGEALPTQHRALLTLTLTPGLGPTLIRRCIDALGSPTAVLQAEVATLQRVEGIGKAKANATRRAMDEVTRGDALPRELDAIDRLRVRLIALGDPAYPALLRHIPDPPPLLFVRGELQQGDALAIAVVGSRRCSAYGREQADRLSSFAAQAGLCVVSGGAFGIDTAAHHAALRAGGRTIAVLGSGLAQPYPKDNVDLFDAIAGHAGSASGANSGQANGRGAVVSELPMHSPPRAENFPRRNRLVSGMALGVLVVEAARRSGALITARLAVEEQYREVMAVPGRVDSPGSEGCHKLLREGWASLVTCGADILDSLGETGELLRVHGVEPSASGAGASDAPDNQNHPPAGQSSPGESSSGDSTSSDAPSNLFAHSLSDSQRKLVEALGSPLSLDDLLRATGLPVHIAQSDLTMLEIRGVLKREAGLYRRAK